jgi:hypothetical protein
MKYPLMRNNILREDLDAVIEHLKQDDPILTHGANVRAFEAEWSQWLGVKYSIFVNSGASANLLSMAILKIRHPDGGEIITPPLTWVSDVASVLQNGFTPVFADIEFNSLISVREFLQRLGTDAIRDGLHTNAWVNALMAGYTPTQVQWADGPIGGYKDGPMPNWIITDTRFPNEAQAIKDKGGLVIRVDRPGVKPVNDHPSETGLDKWDFDYKIANVSDLKALSLTVKMILEKENIL